MWPGRHVAHEAIDRPRQAFGVERHRTVHLGERPADLLGQAPAAGKAQHGGGQYGRHRVVLDDAEILLHEQAREFQRIVGWRGEGPVLAGEEIAQGVAVAGEPVRMMRGEIAGDRVQRLGTCGIGCGECGEYGGMAFVEQPMAFAQFGSIAVVEFEPCRFGKRDQAHGHAIGAGLERQMERFGRQCEHAASLAGHWTDRHARAGRSGEGSKARGFAP